MQSIGQWVIVGLFISFLLFGIACGDDDDDPSESENGAEGDDDAVDDDDDVTSDDDDATTDDDNDDVSDDDDNDNNDSGDDDDDNDDDNDDNDDDDFAGPHSHEGWVVGAEIISGISQAVIWHDQQGTWTQETLPTLDPGALLMSVQAVDSDNVWAVGKKQVSGQNQSLILHRDASGWHEQTVTNPMPGGAAMVDLYMLDANTGWASGTAYNPADGLGILKYESGTWSYPFTDPGYSLMIFNGIHFVSDTEGYIASMLAETGGLAILLSYINDQWGYLLEGGWFDSYVDAYFKSGTDGCALYVMARGAYLGGSVVCTDGTNWDETAVTGMGGCPSRLTTSPDGTYYLTAYDFDGNYFYPVVMVRNQTGWTEMQIPSNLSDHSEGWNIDFPADDLGFVVGTQYDSNLANRKGLVLQYDGSSWKVVAAPSAAENQYFYGASYL